MLLSGSDSTTFVALASAPCAVGSFLLAAVGDASGTTTIYTYHIYMLTYRWAKS